MKKLNGIFNVFFVLALLLAGTPAQPAYAAGIIVNSNADTTTTDSSCTLREAITNANNDAATYPDCTAGTGTDTITFAGNYTITLTSTLPDITDADGLTITGNGAANTIVQAAASAGTATYRIIKINGVGVSAILEKMTLRYGVEASGGAITNANGASLTLNNVTVSDNQVNNTTGTGLNGGAISINGGTLNVNNSAIINNSVTTNDTSSLIRGNGGGIFVGSTGTVNLNNSTVSGNSTIRGGGGLYTNGGTINISYSTIANNISNSTNGTAYSSLDGGGINRNSGTINLKSSIVAGNQKYNSATDAAADCGGTITSQGYNLTGSSTGCSLAGTGDVTVTPSTVFTAVLGSLADNGGSTYTHTLIVGGAAVDVIPNGTNSCGSGTFTTDQRGGVRPYKSSCDIGAYELKTVQGVSTTGTDSGDCTITDCASIAYAYSKSQAGNTINVAAGTYTETSEYDITKNLTISGAGATSTIVQAAASAGIATHRFYKINASGITANIQNLTLRYGVETSGGALNVALGTLNLTNVILSDNQVNNSLGTGLNGGAISVNGATANINNSAIINNSVNTNDTTSTVRGSGGGIFLGSTGTITLNNTTVSGNSSIRGGGGLFTNGGTININYSTIADNTSNSTNGTAYTSLDGGGINRNGGTINLKSSIVAGNKKYNSTTDAAADCSGTITSQGYNLTGSSTGCSLAGTGDITVTPANVFTTVMSSLADNGGNTYTHALMVASPARNTIASGTNTCGTSPFDTDQRSMSRPLYGYCDMGAYEYQDASVPTVNTFAATSPTNNLSIPIMAFTASDNTNVIGFKITELSTAPSAGDSGWTASAPSTYTVGSGGSYTLYPWAKDAQGNVSAVYGSPASVSVDTTAPTVLSITRTDSDPTNSNSVSFTLVFSESVTGVDTGDFTLTTTGSISGASVTAVDPSGALRFVTVDTGSGDGTIRLDVNSSGTGIVDTVGNPLSGGFTSGQSYTIDKTSPTVSMSSSAGDPTNAVIPVTVTFSESVSDFDAGDVTVGNATLSNFSGSGTSYGFDLTASSDGTVTADIAGGTATDSAGNGNSAATQFSRTYDGTAPSIDSFTAPSSSASLSISITAFTASDTNGVTGYLITESATQPASSDSGWSGSAPTTYTVASNGNYTIYPWAKDAIGNVSAVYGSPISVTVDTTAPDVTIDSQPTDPSASADANFTFSSTDGTATFACDLDSTGYSSCSSPMDYASLSNGSHTFSVKATDTVGNTGIADTYTWTISTYVASEHINNGGFNTYPTGKKIPTSWKAVKFSSTDGKNTAMKKEGTASVRITGAGSSKTLSQTLLLSGTAGDAFTFSFWVKGKSVPTAGVCRAQILFYNDATLNPTKPTINCVKGTYGFNQKTLAFNAPGDYTKIIIRFTYSKASGQVWFDAVSLTK